MIRARFEVGHVQHHKKTNDWTVTLYEVVTPSPRPAGLGGMMALRVTDPAIAERLKAGGLFDLTLTPTPR